MKHAALFIISIFLIFPSTIIAQRKIDLHQVEILANRKADTVFGTWKFSVADYEFYEDKMVLLTFTKNMSHASVNLVDEAQKVLSSYNIPDEAQRLYIA